MVYRAVVDPRIAALKQLIATEPDLRAERVRIRREHDALQEQADRLGIEVGQDDGLIAKVLGRAKSPEDIARAQRELDEITTKLAALQATERDLQTRLEGIAGSRQELSTLLAASADALRSSDGPLGDELRAVHAAVQADDEKLAALDAVIVAHDRAETVISGALEAARDASGESVAVKAAITVASIAILETPPTFGMAAGRAESQLAEGRERIGELVALLEPFRRRYELRDRSLDLVSQQLSSLTRTGAPASAATCLERLLAALTSERATIVAHRADLERQQHQILERSL
jgi:hypothetical protein